jgi:hypothetical protein
MPNNPTELSADDVPPDPIPLRLPSAMPEAHCVSSSPFDLLGKERRLRHAQAYDALSDLRKLLRVTVGLDDYKITQIGPSQRIGTRSRALISRFAEKTTRCAERYRAAYSALLALDPNGDWKNHLKVLKDEDIKTPGKGGDESENSRVLSWIWRAEYKSTISTVHPTDFTTISDNDLIDCKLSNVFVGMNLILSTTKKHYGVSGRSQLHELTDGPRKSHC